MRSILIVVAVSLTACATRTLLPSSWPLPWREEIVAAPVPVSELIIEGTAGPAPAVLQYRDRNTLRLDLTRLSGGGALQLHSQPPNGWPVRLAFTVQPGSFHKLEVRGEQRLQFTIADSGEPQTLALPPGVYSATSSVLTLRWE